MFKKERGITLVALVVTIVVLLILAGVSISMVLGNNGIVTKAKDSQAAQDKAYAREVVESALKSVQIDVLTGKISAGSVANVVTAIGDSKFTAGADTNTITYKPKTDGTTTYTVTVDISDVNTGYIVTEVK